MTTYSDLIQTASNYLRLSIKQPIDIMVVLGSGLSDIADEVKMIQEINYQDITGLPKTSAPTHQGKILIVELAGKTIAFCLGRLHLYEGVSAQQVAILTYVMSAIGAKKLIITNAAGALNDKYRPGDIMLINDHINFTGHNPICGEDDSLGVRFADMSQAYNKKLSAKAFHIASELNLPIHTGVYAGVAGPSLETSAERRMLRQWGADAVGMSTVMEVIAANHCGMDVVGISAITNLALGNANQQADTIEEVLLHAAEAGKGIKKIIFDLIEYS